MAAADAMKALELDYDAADDKVQEDKRAAQ